MTAIKPGDRVVYRGWSRGIPQYATVELVREMPDHSTPDYVFRLKARLVLDDGTTNEDWVDRLEPA